MRVLVCGGAGYIGSNMTAMLNAEGYEAVVFDNLGTGHRAAVVQTKLIKGDLADYKLLVTTLKKYNIEAVMHFAASIEVGESVRAPLKYYRNNLCSTQNLLSAMEVVGVEKLVFSSTALSMDSQTAPITEERRPNQSILTAKQSWQQKECVTTRAKLENCGTHR